MSDRIKVLLIDDDVEFIDNFGWFLDRRSYKVFKACSGGYGIEIAKEENPQVILCDLLLTDMNGEEVLKEVKRTNPNSIFIIMTAYIDGKTHARLTGLGTHSFIEKIVEFKPTEKHIGEALKEKGIIMEEKA